MSATQNLKPFVAEPDDPYFEEHALVSAWVEAAAGQLGEHEYYRDVDLKSIPSGQSLLTGDVERSRRLVMAALIQVEHHDGFADRIRAQAKTEFERINPHMDPGWNGMWVRRRHAAAVISALMRRNLPFAKLDMLALLNWCCQSEHLTTFHAPIGAVTRALERYAATSGFDPGLQEMVRDFADRLRSAHDKDARRLATTVEQLLAGAKPDRQPATTPTPSHQAKPKPELAGHPAVLFELKRKLGMLPSDPAPTTTELAPDRFALVADTPLRVEHEMLSGLFGEVVGTPRYANPDLDHTKIGKRLNRLQPAEMGRVMLAAAERHVGSLLCHSTDVEHHEVWQSRYSAAEIARAFLEFDIEVDRPGTFDLLLYLSVLPAHQEAKTKKASQHLVQAASRAAAGSPLTEGERFVLSLYRASRVSGPALGSPTEEVAALTTLVNDGATFYLAPGEVWSDTVNDDISQFDDATRRKWSDLLFHALSATVSRPSAKWVKKAKQLVDGIGEEQVGAALAQWLPLVAQGQSIRKFGRYAGDTRGGSDTIHEENANCLRGLLWCVPILPKADSLARPVVSAALSAYKKVPGVGPRAVKVGNAAVYALSELASKEAVGHLAMLKVRVRFGTAQKEIEKAFDAAAEALGLPRDQIEELGVPTYGLEEVGRMTEEFAGYRAELIVTGSDAVLRWSDAQGKTLKSAPAKIKKERKDDLKELQQSMKDIQSMLPAQRDRLDSMFLLQKSWPIAEWRERYHDHPLVGTIARRLLWCVDGTPAIFLSGAPTDLHGTTIPHGQTAEITLWHPVCRRIEEITAWRQRLETLVITQPFKQAYREVYLLTDAERNTRTYSNRFAAHIIRQHQFNALCAARGWKNKLRLMVDDCYAPPAKSLPQWGLRAEFWVEGIGQEYGADTNDAGVFLRLATDQVRFYGLQAAQNYAHAGGGGYGSIAAGPGQYNVNDPLTLEEVPDLVFSEIMRDVDLFVGVASVGNDPTWQDGGPGGVYRDYWHNYSFGEIAGAAVTRKQALERLIPRLKIAKHCSFTERFLVVRGSKRTYKIHLGSGNILMEPNDQYLCIVPDSRSRAAAGVLYLPFEGDATLSIIISKALLLADDAKIKDSTITRQIDTV